MLGIKHSAHMAGPIVTPTEPLLQTPYRELHPSPQDMGLTLPSHLSSTGCITFSTEIFRALDVGKPAILLLTLSRGVVNCLRGSESGMCPSYDTFALP